ncbi:hypothetical protein KC323_g8432 [Hortaea werneckii]|nr:hypothetical protein KC323_g8432 [Hortaea werneckii]
MPTPTPLPHPSSPNPNNIPAETGPPTHSLRKREYIKHRNNERAAIRTHLDRFIANVTTTTSTAAAADRWKFLLAQREEKVRERVSRGKGSVRELFPDFWDEGREAEWLRNGWRVFLEGGVDGCKSGKAGLGVVGREEEDRDDDEEMVVVGVQKEEEGEGVGDGGEVGGVGWGSGGGRSQQVVGMEGSSLEVKMEMGGEGTERAAIPGWMDEMDGQGKVQGKKLGRGKGKARLVNEAMVGVPCSRGWAIQNTSVEAIEELVDMAKTGPSDIVLGFAGPRGALFEHITTDGVNDDFEPGIKRKAEDEMVLPGKKSKFY